MTRISKRSSGLPAALLGETAKSAPLRKRVSQLPEAGAALMHTFRIGAMACALALPCNLFGIMAGGEFDAPHDAPSLRLDLGGSFSFVGALSIESTANSFKGTAVALSPTWILTAAHNADLDDNGLPDVDWSADFHLPSFGIFSVLEARIHPDFTGFGASINDDLALLRLSSPLPEGIVFPHFGGSVVLGDTITLVGFGRSGYGSYGYTTQASLTDRRSGENTIDSFALDDEGGGAAEVFRYDFDAPSSVGLPGGSLGNARETLIGPGDSGGPAMVLAAEGWSVEGINTFTEGYGGRFDDIGGGVILAPYRDWIVTTTGIPEPATVWLLSGGLAFLLARRLMLGWRP